MANVIDSFGVNIPMTKTDRNNNPATDSHSLPVEQCDVLLNGNSEQVRNVRVFFVEFYRQAFRLLVMTNNKFLQRMIITKRLSMLHHHQLMKMTHRQILNVHRIQPIHIRISLVSILNHSLRQHCVIIAKIARCC